MPKAPMNKHKGNKREGLLAKSKMGCYVRYRVADRNKAVFKDKPGKGLLVKGHLSKIYQHISSDNHGIYGRIVLGLNCVSDGDHGLFENLPAQGSRKM
jgi:hypothetical protein